MIFHTIGQIKHDYYEYITHPCRERSHGYRLKMIIGSEHRAIIQTIRVRVIGTILRMILGCKIRLTVRT